MTTSPVIVIGMHRSGTSMVARILARLGLFVGWERDGYAEAVFFSVRHEAVLAAQGARWDHPAPLDPLLEDAAMRGQLVEALRRELRSPAVMSFLGPARYLRWRSPEHLPYAWGWKDPRSTLFLPLWLDVFPEARVIHVVRNGVDVALSLSVRERRRRADLRSGTRVGERARTIASERHDVPWLPWLLWQVQLRFVGGRTAWRLRRWRLHPCIDLEEGFTLWTDYLRRAERATPAARGGVFEIRYEDVLAEPDARIRELAAFCGLSVTDDQIAAASRSVARPASNRLDDSRARRFHESVRGNEWMRKWGYGQ